MTYPVARAEALDARVRSVIARVAAGHPPFATGESYDAIARDLAAFQAEFIPGYARLLHARGVSLTESAIESLPAVPTDAFRLARIATFPPSLASVVFRTSGTTSGDQGAHAMRTLETYRSAAITWADQTLFAPFAEQPVRVIAIAPSLDRAPDSSLTQMFAWFVDRAGALGRWSEPDDLERIARVLQEASTNPQPTIVMATAFAWMHLADSLADQRFSLPARSLAVQTGGFKGRTREVSPGELRARIAQTLTLPGSSIVGEYGMTELTSQLWAIDDSSEPGAPFRYRAPPWMRLRACDPVTLAGLLAGVSGIARVEDLGNVESAWAVQTADEIVVDEAGAVVILGRLAGSEARGCSLAVEELVGAADRSK